MILKIIIKLLYSMGSLLCKKAKNSDINTEIKSLGCTKIFVGCMDGYVQEFSMVENGTFHNPCKILNSDIRSMAKTLDNKS